MKMMFEVVGESGRRGLPMMEMNEKEGRKMCSGGGADDEGRSSCRSAKKVLIRGGRRRELAATKAPPYKECRRGRKITTAVLLTKRRVPSTIASSLIVAVRCDWLGCVVAA
jgi:hypothetical protein